MSIAVQRWLRVAGIIAILALLLVFSRGVEWAVVVAVVRGADSEFLVLALVCNLISLTMKGVRWWVLLRPLGVRSLSLVLRATFAGASLNNLLVAQGGEGARALLVSRASGVSSARVFAALALERTLDVVSYLVLLGGGAWLFPLPERIARWQAAASVLLGAALTALIALGLVGRRVRLLSLGSAGERAPSYLRRFAGSFREVGSLPRVAVALALSLGAWALQVVTYHLTARAAHLPLPFAGSVAAMLSVGISFLVRATPGNVGVFQAVYALTVRSFGIAEDAAIAAALLIQAVQVLPILVIGTLVTPRLARRATTEPRA
ncbi:MAG: flippase-like domain-containing protein [Gemmatimonadota bacterium]|nr:flippase-like domain-containing protein [Gemmatimonadota bacterium]